MSELLELKRSVDELQRTTNEFKTEHDRVLADVKAGKYVPKDIIEKVDRINEKGIDSLLEKVEKIETAMNRARSTDGKDNEERQLEAKKAANQFLKKGIVTPEGTKAIHDSLPDEYKALSVDSDPDGGYLVRPEISNDIQKKIFESSPIRQLASTITIGTDVFEEPADWDEAEASWVGEQQSRLETGTPQLKMLRINVHEMQAMPKASQKLLDDASVNMEAWLADHVEGKFARKEATAFVSGNGVGQPRGILSYASGTDYNQIEQVASGTSGAVTADGLISLQDALFEEFQANATFLMKRATRTAVRKLKDANDRYLFSLDGGLNDSVRMSLLGRPIALANDMPAIAVDALAIAYGDFRRAYLVIDRIGIRVLRDPYTAKPFVLFYTTKRVGGAMRHFQALKLQKLA